MKYNDAIIVGAGPAGSTCAARLHAAGLKVKMFDKEKFPRAKPCAGWITPPVIESLQLDIHDYQSNNILQPITGFRSGMIGGRIVEIDYRQPVSYGIRRIEFDQYLLRRSRVVCEYSAVHKIERRGNLWQVNDSDAAPLLIGAGGNFCPVARFCKKRDAKPARESSKCKPGAPVVFAQEVEFDISAHPRNSVRISPEKPSLYFCPDLKGYGWCFRKGRFVNIGLGRVESPNLPQHVNDFCKFLIAQEQIVEEVPTRFSGHAYRLYAESAPFLSSDGVLLIGDAAGLAYPQSGEGIRPAVESAILASEIVLDAEGDYQPESLLRYDKRVAERFGPAKPVSPWSWLPAGWLRMMAARLMATNWFNRKVVVENWFIRRGQDAL